MFIQCGLKGQRQNVISSLSLNDFDVFVCDVRNAYLNGPCKEKIWFVAKIVCGKEAYGNVMRLCQALDGLKSSSASWRKMLKDFYNEYV